MGKNKKGIYKRKPHEWCEKCGELLVNHYDDPPGCPECCSHDKCVVCERCADCYIHEFGTSKLYVDEVADNNIYYCDDCVPEELRTNCQKCDEPLDEHGCLECCGYDICTVCGICLEECYFHSGHSCTEMYIQEGNRSTIYYCPNCVPYEIKEEIDRERELEREEDRRWSIQISPASQQLRHEELVRALHEAGLELRSDSKLCEKYIRYGTEDLNYVVRRMCQMKYLFDYCNMREMLNHVAREHEETLEAGYFPDMGVFEEAEFNVLNSIRGYPIVWPWQSKRYFNFVKGKSSNECPICREVLGPCVVTTCKHRFHKKCIKTWLKQQASCPCCRETIVKFKS